MRTLPSGTVTLLFTDIEGSTRLLQELGDAYSDVLREHRRVLREAFTRHAGVEVDTQGDAFFYAFNRAADAIAAAEAGQRSLAKGVVRVRMGIHTGEPLLGEEGYVGLDVHKGARIAGCAHGGQVLLSVSTRELVDAELRDLGPHRLKDLTAPERLYQLGFEEFPPLKTLDATNLPVASSPLLGRTREVNEIVSLLSSGTRLVTVTGPGGTGKTRLALQVAAELVGSLRDGVFWVPLAGLSEPELVLPTIAQSLGTREDLRAYPRDKELLLLLDNLEHLLAAGPALAELLGGAPGLRMLVTSRSPLHLRGESEYPLEPLPEQDAVTLFLERAREVGRDFELGDTVRAICRRLDGLPLAVELAAARSKILSPDQLLDRLERALPLLTGGARDAPERQQTLRATIEWSYELLEEGAKELFARLSVFAGRYPLEAAERVCEADLDSLAALVDLSLLKPIGDDRFIMLATIREYARERLAEAGGGDILRDRHAEYLLDVVESTRPADMVGSSIEWAAGLELFHDDLVGALTWLESRDPQRAMRLLSGLSEYWYRRGRIAEGRRWLESALSATANETSLTRSTALRAAAHLAIVQADYETAAGFYERDLIMCRELGDDRRAAEAQMNLGLTIGEFGDRTGARAILEEVKESTSALNDADLRATACNNLGYLALMDGDTARAIRLLEEAVGTWREAEPVQEYDVAFGLGQLGLALVEGGRSDEARGVLVSTLETYRKLGAQDESMLSVLLSYAAAEAALGEIDQACRLFGAVDAHANEGEISFEPIERALRARMGSELQERLGPARFNELCDEGGGLTVDRAVASALGLVTRRTP